MNCWFFFKTGKRSFRFGGPIIISFQFSGVRRFEGDDHMALTEVSSGREYLWTRTGKRSLSFSGPEIISFHFSAQLKLSREVFPFVILRESMG